MGTLTINNAACNIVIYRPEYGLLYNWYAAADERNITSSADWVVPSKTQIQTMVTYLGVGAGTKLKVGGSSGFNAKSSGQRVPAFQQKGNQEFMTSSTALYALVRTILNIYTANTEVILSDGNNYKYEGTSVRLLYTGVGTPTSYTGNDGKIYRAVTIGTQTWLADNLCETKFRNGDVIPWHGANPASYFTNEEWAALTTAGCCAYDNDVNNVASGFTFPS